MYTGMGRMTYLVHFVSYHLTGNVTDPRKMYLALVYIIDH